MMPLGCTDILVIISIPRSKHGSSSWPSDFHNVIRTTANTDRRLGLRPSITSFEPRRIRSLKRKQLGQWIVGWRPHKNPCCIHLRYVTYHQRARVGNGSWCSTDSTCTVASPTTGSCGAMQRGLRWQDPAMKFDSRAGNEFDENSTTEAASLD